jgi:hypothetical protein
MSHFIAWANAPRRAARGHLTRSPAESPRLVTRGRASSSNTSVPEPGDPPVVKGNKTSSGPEEEGHRERLHSREEGLGGLGGPQLVVDNDSGRATETRIRAC